MTIAILSLLLILLVALVVGRLATAALTATGIPNEIAKFQARSALTGAGFTTNESESIVGHPARRRIIMLLMLVGNVGGAAGIASVITATVRIGTTENVIIETALLFGGLAAILTLSRIPWLDRLLVRLFAGLVQRYTEVDLHDYAGMLRLSGDYGVDEVFVEEDDWLADKSLADLDLSHEGILVLGIVRHDTTYIGAPKGDSYARPGDTLILYGRAPRFAELAERRRGYAGERAHQAAVIEQRLIEQRQKLEDAG